MMELVLRYLPENSTALYHVGMAAYLLGEHSQAIVYLREFVRVDQQGDYGPMVEVQATLDRIEQNIPANNGYGGYKYVDLYK